SVISFVANSSLALLILKIRLSYFASFKWYLMILPLNNILYTFTLQFMDIVSALCSQGIVRDQYFLSGQKGVGLYLACVSHYYTSLFLLFLFRFSLVYKGDYATSPLHGFLSSSTAIFPSASCILLFDAFYFSLPTFFHRPDADSVDFIAPAMKSFFDKGRDYGYVMQIIWVYGNHGLRARNILGAMGTITIILLSLISFVMFSRYIKRFTR
ncbi:hypothetical protein PFISCL1PPCAC_14610, partial [Pristionchus fissidentatus]